MFSNLAVTINNFFVKGSLVLIWLFFGVLSLSALAGQGFIPFFMMLALGLLATVIWALASGLWLMQLAQLEELKKISEKI